jgi:hypothetical protein
MSPLIGGPAQHFLSLIQGLTSGVLLNLKDGMFVCLRHLARGSSTGPPSDERTFAEKILAIPEQIRATDKTMATPLRNLDVSFPLA